MMTDKFKRFSASGKTDRNCVSGKYGNVGFPFLP